MAAQAKVIISYDRALWRDNGQSGNAFVTHEQAVIGQIFDACDSTSTKAALGGFLALSPELRQSFREGLPLLMGNQVGQIFGPELEHGDQFYQDWATEPYTCSASDRGAQVIEHVDFANPFLRRVLWEGKLYLGGSETAAHGAGYLEGALEAAKRIDRDLARAWESIEQAASPKLQTAAIDRSTASSERYRLGQLSSSPQPQSRWPTKGSAHANGHPRNG